MPGISNDLGLGTSLAPVRIDWGDMGTSFHTATTREWDGSTFEERATNHNPSS